MSKKIIVIAGILAATTAFALSQREARVAKERMSRCSYNDAVCVGQVMVDALAADDNGGGRPAPYPGTGRDKAVVVYGSSDTCGGTILGTVIVNSREGLQEMLNKCNAFSNAGANSWSYSIDGVCADISDSSPKSVCTAAVIKANAQN